MKKLAPSSKLTVKGKTQSVTKWAKALGVPVQTILGRLDRGWSAERAVSEAAGKGGSNRGKTLAAEVLTPEELQELLKHCNDGATGCRNRALIVIGWRSGLRCSEALALLPKDLDERSQTVRVLHGKGNKSRTVGLDGQAWEFIRAWLERRVQLSIGDECPIFCTLKGAGLSDRYVRSMMERTAEEAGISKRVHFHGLRHTMAFELASEGVPMHLIQQQLGHSNLAITSRYISHLNPAETIARMKSRSWGKQLVHNAEHTAECSASPVPPPDWLTRLRADIGDRLMFVHDSRSSDEFKAIVLLF